MLIIGVSCLGPFIIFAIFFSFPPGSASFLVFEEVPRVALDIVCGFNIMLTAYRDTKYIHMGHAPNMYRADWHLSYL